MQRQRIAMLCGVVGVLGGTAVTSADDNVRRGDLTIDVSGKYNITAKGPDGKDLSGTLDLQKIKGERYKGKAKIGKKSYFVTAYRDGDILNATWAEKSFVGQTVFHVGCDKSLEGLSFGADKPNASEELLTGGNSDVTGTYKMLGFGEGEWWNGSAAIKLANDVFSVTFNSDGDAQHGIGLRTGEVLMTCARSDNTQFSLMQLRIDKDGNTLSGKWATRAQKPAGAGTVTWKK
jgi:hypothetical protein